MWEALGQRAPGGSPGSAGLVQHLEEYAATLAKNMELTYLNPVGLVTPNISMWQEGIEDWERAQAGSPRAWELLTKLLRWEVSLAPQCFAEGLCSGPDSTGEMWEGDDAEGGTPPPQHGEKSVLSLFFPLGSAQY